mgnify:CR=1 FL=1
MEEYEDALSGFRRFLQGYSKATQNTYMSVAKSFLNFLNGKPLRDVTRDDVLKFVETYDNPWSKALVFKALKTFFVQYLERPDPFKNVKIPAPETNVNFWVDEDKIIEAIKKEPEFRYKVLLALMYDLALRRSEVVRIRVEDIDFDHMIVRVWVSKRRKLRAMLKPMSRLTASLLKKYLSITGKESGELFDRLHPVSVTRIVKRMLKRVGVDFPKGLHQITRHSRAVNMRFKNVDIADIKEFLGHSDIRSTMVYASIGSSRLAGRIPEFGSK